LIIYSGKWHLPIPSHANPLKNKEMRQIRNAKAGAETDQAITETVLRFLIPRLNDTAPAIFANIV
jgi:hypothetical protein